MAAVLESVTVPRSSVIRAASHAPIMASSSSSSTRSLTSSFKVGALSEFKGLKIQPPRRTFASVGLKKNSSVNRRGIVCETQKTTLEVPGVTDATWQSLVVESTLPVLVEFWAPWCGPCRMIHPVIGELSKEYAGKLSCYNLNTDESPGVATKYGIRSIPTVMIFKGGEKKDAIIGAVPKTTLSSSIERFL